ncbi:MAG: SDR family oxidoreductase, partial [Caldilineaceae bacterium]
MDRKTALVTGASSGIGREIALELAKRGIEVIINFSKSIEKAEAVKNEIIATGGMAHIFQADITLEDNVARLFEFASSRFDALDILVNNAGVYAPSFIESHDARTWDQILDLNLKSKLLCTKHAVPLLKKSLMPRIINIASRCSVKPIEESAAYCCAAAGIAMLTRVSALELSKYNIRVNTVSPG